MNEDECVATDSIVLIFVVRLEVALLEIRELRGRHDFNRPCVTCFVQISTLNFRANFDDLYKFS